MKDDEIKAAVLSDECIKQFGMTVKDIWNINMCIYHRK